MNRSVRYKKKKILLFLEEEGCLDAFISAACEFSQQVEASFGAGKNLYKKNHTGIQILFEFAYEYLH